MSVALTPPARATAERWNTLADALRDRAVTHADELGYAEADGTSVTFGELAERASALARALAARGIGPGDRVALGVSAGVAFAEIFWALQLLGAVPCAFAPNSNGAPLSERAAVAKPVLVLDDEAVAAMPRDVGGPLPHPPSDPDAIAYVQPTSGTSGSPRAAQLTHRNALAFLRAGWDMGHVTASDVFVTWVPPWHDLGLVRFLLGTVYLGVPCHIVRPAITTIPEWLRTISRVRGTVSGAPDFAFRLATRMTDATDIDLTSLRYITNGGEPARKSSMVAFEEHFGVKGVVLPGYGLAEATLGVTTHVPGDEVGVDTRGNVTCGWPLPGFEVRAGSSVDAPDEILVRGEAVFVGYLDAPDDTSSRLLDGWLHTGDSGYLDDQGRLYVLGRRAGMLKRGGAVIAPRELEEAAQTVAAVTVAAAVGVADGGREAITVVVEAAEQTDELVRSVSRGIAERTGVAPDRVVVVPPRSIPRTDNGKVRHGYLRELLESPNSALAAVD